MFSLFRKEIAQFFHSLSGFIVIGIFLLTSSLFLWVLPGEFNLLDSKIASLKGLFDLAPWIYLFLIPALTMRSFAEERTSSTFDLLLARPISKILIILGKYFASVTLVLISLVPTLIYVFSVEQLGYPKGNLDVGATIGSYIGLVLLSMIYCAIGTLCSALSKNQINAFLMALIACFVCFIGFDFMSELAGLSETTSIWETLSINQHYLSISRGVIDSRDLLFFIGSSTLFLFLTLLVISPKSPTSKARNWKRTGIVFASLVVLFNISSIYFFRYDMTVEKRYSIADVSKKILNDLPFPLHIQIYLDGEMPAGMRQLRDAMVEKASDLKAYSSNPISIRVIDPYDEVKPSEEKQYFSYLRQKGLHATNLQVKEEGGNSSRWIFPSLIVRGGGKEVVVNALKNNPTLSAQQNLTTSMELIEFELMRAIKLILQNEKPKVAFLQGQQELNEFQVRDITTSLSGRFDFSHLQSIELNDPTKEPKLLIVADPERPFQEKDKYEIDQFIMRGGRVLWMVDPIQVSLDSLQNSMTTLAYGRDLNLTDQLFRYGVRLNPDLVQDIDCLLIPIDMSARGQQADFKPMPWYFSPLVNVNPKSPIGKGVNRLMGEFVSTVQTVGKNKEVTSEVVLYTSPYSRIKKTPMEVNLAMVQEKATKEAFRYSHVPVGVLLEGAFDSNYKNRMVQALGITQKGKQLNKSAKTKMMVIADGNLLANKYKFKGSQPEFLPLGYDRFSKTTFGNRDFFINAIQYLCDDTGVMQLSSRVIKHRPLDKVKTNEEKSFWQLLNVVAPLITLLLLAPILWYVRKKRYSRA